MTITDFSNHHVHCKISAVIFDLDGTILDTGIQFLPSFMNIDFDFVFDLNWNCGCRGCDEKCVERFFGELWKGFDY